MDSPPPLPPAWRPKEKGPPPLPSQFAQGASYSAKYCTQCGFVGTETRYRTGSTFIEILLYCFFILPGVFYSLIRSKGAYRGCPTCGAHNMVPLDSPVAKQALSAKTVTQVVPQSIAIAETTAIRFCTYCGTQVPAVSRYCGGCGREKITV